MHYIFFIHPPADGHPDQFWNFPFVNSVAVNADVPKSLWYVPSTSIEFYCLILFEWGCERPCRGRRLTLMSPSVVLHFIFRDRFPMKLELTSSTCLAGQWAPGICLCFLPQCHWLAFMWVLGLLMITGQAPYPLGASAAPSLLLFNVRFYGMLKFVLSSLQSSKEALMGILWIVVSFLIANSRELQIIRINILGSHVTLKDLSFPWWLHRQSLLSQLLCHTVNEALGKADSEETQCILMSLDIPGAYTDRAPQLQKKKSDQKTHWERCWPCTCDLNISYVSWQL